jgi:hypothetical protein
MRGREGKENLLPANEAAANEMIERVREKRI